MYNILTDKLPDTIQVFDKTYPIHTSFRNWLKISMLAEEGVLRDGKKTAEILKLCYKETLPPTLPSAILAALYFLEGDRECTGSSKGKRLFSFEKDADMIYAAFFSKYGIDLAKTDLHWYAFLSLFSALAEDNPFRTVLKIRMTDEKEVKDKKARAALKTLKQRFSLGKSEEVDVAGELAGLF